MIQLAKDENVFYPMPYVEGEAHLLVITNQRVVHFGDEGKQELPAKQIQFIGRTSGRPFVTWGVLLLLLGVVSLGLGVYWVATSGLLSHVPTAPPGDDPSQPQPGAPETDTDEEAPPPPDLTIYKILGVALTAGGLLLLVGGILLVRVNRHWVIVRGGQTAVQIRCASTMEQTQILATLGALQSTGKAMVAQEAPAPKPKVQVDDKGDPVKALQDLQAARQAGKIGEEEFAAKREILVQRVRARR